jgi:hypothetical protein
MRTKGKGLIAAALLAADLNRLRAEEQARIDRDLARMTPEDRAAYLSGDPDKIADLVKRALAGKLKIAPEAAA